MGCTNSFDPLFGLFGHQRVLRSARPDCRPSDKATDTVTVDLSRLSEASNGDISHKAPLQGATAVTQHRACQRACQ